MRGPRAGEVADNVAEPPPPTYLVSLVVDDPSDLGEPLEATDETPEVPTEQHYYRLVDGPEEAHRRWLSEHEVARAEWSTWAFYVHAPELGSP